MSEGDEEKERRDILSKETIEKCRDLKDLTDADIDEIQEVKSFGSNWVLPALCEQIRRERRVWRAEITKLALLLEEARVNSASLERVAGLLVRGQKVDDE